MKRRIIVLSFMVVLFVLICAVASATELCVRDSYVNWQVGLSSERPVVDGGFFSRGDLCWIDGYESGKVEWDVTTTDGGPDLVMLPTPYEEEWAMLSEDPDETYTAGNTLYHYTISATYNDQTYTKNVEIKFVPKTLPTGFSLTVTPVDMTTTPATLGTKTVVQDGKMYMETGKTYAVAEQFSNVPDVIFGYFVDEVEWSWTEWEEIQINDNPQFMDQNGDLILNSGLTQIYTAKKPGEYDHMMVLCFGESNLGYYIPYTLYLKDEQGNILGPQLDYAPAEVTWYTDLPQHNQSQSGPFSMYSMAEMLVPWNVKDYDDLNTVWRLDHVSGTDQFALDHNINEYSSGDEYFWASVKAKSSTLTDGDSVYTMKCAYKNKIYEGKVTIHAVSGVNLPTQLNLRAFKTDTNGNTIGEEIPITDDVITVKAGDNFYLSGNANGSIPGINTESVFLNITYYDFEGYTIRGERWSGASDAAKGIYGNNTAMFTALKPGNYRIEPWIYPSYKTNFSVAHPITLRITEGVPTLENTPVEATWYTGLSYGGPGQSGIYSMSAVGQVWFPSELRDYDDLDIAWNLKHESGPDNFVLYQSTNDQWLDRYFNALAAPKSGQLTPGDSVYTMQATYKGVTYEGTLTIHTVDTGMPTAVTFRVFETSGSDIGDEVLFDNDTLTVESGKKYWFTGLFTGGNAQPDNQWINNMYNGGVTQGNRWSWGDQADYGITSANTQMFTATTAGSYATEADLSIGGSNLAWSMPFTLVVTDSSTVDPYFPEPQISVNREYFADEEVNISLPWVTGAEYHEIRIFSQDGTEPYTWGNVSWGKNNMQGSTCCFQINVEGSDPSQNRLMDPGDYYAVITVRGPGYSETTFRRDFKIRSENSSQGGGHGNDPGTAPILTGNYNWTDNTAEEIGYTIYTGISMNSNGNAVWNRWEFINFSISNYNSIATEISGTPMWSVETTSGNVDYHWDTSDNGDHIWGGLNSIPEQPTEAIIQVNCNWGDYTVSRTIKLHVVNPTFTPPTGLDNLPDVIETQVGETLTIAPTILPADWSLSGYSQMYFAANGLGNFADRAWSYQSSVSAKYTVRTPGIYHDTIGFSYGALMVTKEVTFRVKDENGNIPAPTLEISDNRGGSHEMNFYLGMRYTENEFYIGEVQTEPQIDHFYFNNAGQMEMSYPNDTAVWKITKISGTAELKKITDWDPYDMDLQLKKLPNGPEDAKWKIECDWGPGHWETIYTVHFKNSPTGLPTGIDMDFGDVLVVKSGDPLGLASKVRFKNGWNIPGERNYVMIGGAENIFEGVTQDENWEWDIAAKPGVYDANASRTCGNVRWIENFTLIVTEADGTIKASDYRPVGTIAKVPADTTKIESQAFAGTKITEVDIPAGVEIADDAFAGSGLIAVYTHNDEDTIEWAVSHEIVAVTE